MDISIVMKELDITEKEEVDSIRNLVAASENSRIRTFLKTYRLLVKLGYHGQHSVPHNIDGVVCKAIHEAYAAILQTSTLDNVGGFVFTTYQRFASRFKFIDENISDEAEADRARHCSHS